MYVSGGAAVDLQAIDISWEAERFLLPRKLVDGTKANGWLMVLETPTGRIYRRPSVMERAEIDSFSAW